MSLVLREARTEDAPALAAAEAETARTPGFLVSRPDELQTAAFAAKITHLAVHGCYLVAERDGRAVGHALLDPSPMGARQHVFQLTIVVHPGHTGQGIGRQLMQVLLDWAEADARVGKIELRVRAGNRRAIRLYKHFGFREEGRFRMQNRLPDGSYLDDITMGWFPNRNRRWEPVALEGRYVHLEPLSFDHLDGLCAAGLDASLWEWIPNPVRNRDDMRDYIENALDEQWRGVSLPFATALQEGGRVAGCTRFGNMNLEHKRVEIGWTWVGVPWQRTEVNTEAKYLMLKYAFETLGCLRVELKTDALNTRSRQAILRLGAKQEGILRSHILTASGRMRDTVYFSILADEWPAVRAALKAKLNRSTST